MRIGRDRFVRNVLIAAGNSVDFELIPQVERLLDDASPVVRGAAIWALGKLSAERFAVARVDRATAESDFEVRGEWASFEGL